MPTSDAHNTIWRLSRDMMCVANAQGYFEELNPRWTQVLGWTEEELRAKPFLDFVHPADVPATLAEVAKLAQGVPTLYFENRYKTASGEWRWLAWTCEAAGDKLYAIARDATTRKQNTQLELERVRAESRAHASEIVARYQRTLLNAASHELRTPLTPIRIEILQLKRLATPETKRSVEILERNVERLNTLISALLGVTRSGPREPDLQPPRLGDAILEVVTTEAPGTPIDIDPQVLNAGVPEAIQSAIGELVKNARIHGGGPTRVRASRTADGFGVRVEVADAGPGFANPAAGEEWFIPLWRGAHTQGMPGVGLGLTRVRLTAAEAHGSAGLASPGIGQGVTAWIEFPAAT